MGQRTVEHGVEIERSPEDVFAIVDAHEADARWRKGFVAIAKTTPGPVGVGTEYRETVKTFGRRVEATVRVRERVAGRRLAYDIVSGSKAFVVGYAFSPTPGGTRVVRTIEADFGPISPLAALVAGLLRRSLAGDLPALKRLLEAEQRSLLAA
jgi:hypothetical protein